MSGEVRRSHSIVACLLESPAASSAFHLACLNNGLFLAPHGIFVLSTITTESTVAEVVGLVKMSLRDVARAATRR